jgi:hypothetical protein
MPNRQRDANRTRILITQESARIMAEEGVKDFFVAKRKAATRLGVSNKALLPGNAEIEQALLEYQRLFKSAQQTAQLRLLRESAIQAMTFLARFHPRLVGSVLSGTAGPHADVNLHVFADTPEDVIFFLMEHNIPFETGERRLRLGQDDYAFLPMFSFVMDGVNIDLTVFTPAQAFKLPRSPVDNRPMERASVKEVQALLV